MTNASPPAETARARWRRRGALAALLGVTLAWGWTFTWMKQAISAGRVVLGASGDRAAIALYVAIRFGVAAVLLPLTVPAARRLRAAGAVTGGTMLGAVLLAAFLLQMEGLREVSPGVSAFLTSLYVPLTALCERWIPGRTRGAVTRTRRATMAAAVVLATFGAAFIQGPPHGTFGWAEWATVACAALFALEITLTDRLTRRFDPYPLTTVMFVTVALGALASLAAALPAAVTWRALVELAATPAFAWPTWLSAVLATYAALTLMNRFQRTISPTRAAILYALEPVWATLVALAAGLDRLSIWFVLGASALLTGNIVAELGSSTAVPSIDRDQVSA